MELKRSSFCLRTSAMALLIVPYGIETKEGIIKGLELKRLLIVPYGIETIRKLTPRECFRLF